MGAVEGRGTAGIISACVALGLLAWWALLDPAPPIVRFDPGLDNRPAGASVAGVVAIGEFFEPGDGTPSSLPGSWAGFRGPASRNIASSGIPLADSWPHGGPRVLWEIDLGEGYAAPAVESGRVYILDYDEARGGDALRCLSLDDGREIWRRWYRVDVKRNHGRSRTIPAVSDGFVVSLGPRAHVMCLDAQSGDLRWGLDLVADFGAEVPLWHGGQCPLIDEGVAILAVGGDALLMGVACDTGEILWRTPNPTNLEMSHSSVIPMTILGTRMYVYCALGAVVGVSAEPQERGRLLWIEEEWAPWVAAPSPVHIGDGRIFVTAGYGAGGGIIEIVRTSEGLGSRLVSRWSPKEGLASEQQTPVYYQGHLYAILPKDAGERMSELACADLEGRIVWSSGREHRFGLGPVVMAAGKLFVLSDDGEFTMARVSAEGLTVLDRAKVLNGRDAWGPICIAGSRMLVRDSTTMVCLNVGR